MQVNESIIQENQLDNLDKLEKTQSISVGPLRMNGFLSIAERISGLKRIPEGAKK